MESVLQPAREIHVALTFRGAQRSDQLAGWRAVDSNADRPTDSPGLTGDMDELEALLAALADDGSCEAFPAQ